MNPYFEYDSTSAEGELGDVLYGFVRMLKPEIVVETGCYFGYTTVRLGIAVKTNGGGHVYSCDIVPGRVEEARKRCEGLPVTVLHIPSLQLLELQKADFIFSDSDHNIRAQEIDLAKPGAVIVIHDTCLNHRMRSPAHERLANHILKLGGLLFEGGRGFGLLIKP